MSTSQSAKSGWQPIETAPKDGTAILAFGRCPATSFVNPETGEERPYPPVQAVVEWESPNKYFPTGGWCLTAGVESFDAEKWQPLPEPPATVEDDAA